MREGLVACSRCASWLGSTLILVPFRTLMSLTFFALYLGEAQTTRDQVHDKAPSRSLGWWSFSGWCVSLVCYHRRRSDSSPPESRPRAEKVPALAQSGRIRIIPGSPCGFPGWTSLLPSFSPLSHVSSMHLVINRPCLSPRARAVQLITSPVPLTSTRRHHRVSGSRHLTKGAPDSSTLVET